MIKKRKGAGTVEKTEFMLLLTCRYPSGKKHMRIRVTSITDRKQPAQSLSLQHIWGLYTLLLAFIMNLV